MERNNNRVIIIAAPSGCGKSTIVKYLCSEFSCLYSPISCTTRGPRGNEVPGKSYYYISVPEFKTKEAGGEFIETAEVYPGLFYGTLKSEVESKPFLIFDVDVEGAMNLKSKYGDSALYILLTPPSLDTLRERLVERGENTEDEIEVRLGKARSELLHAIQAKERPRPDYTIQNIDLRETKSKVKLLVSRHLDPEYPHLFLDIDGVLNSEAWFNGDDYRNLDHSDPHNSFDPRALEYLKEILRRTDAFLVVSSSWRIQTQLPHLFKDLGLPDLFDTTPYLYYPSDCGGYELRSRGEEIQSYIDEHKVSKYCILDDDHDFLESQESHLVSTSWLRGLQEGDIEKTINILRK